MPSYRHKDTPESFWERMKAIHGYDPPPAMKPITVCSAQCADAGKCCLDNCPLDMRRLNDD